MLVTLDGQWLLKRLLPLLLLIDAVDLHKELSTEGRREIDNLYNTKLQAAEEL